MKKCIIGGMVLICLLLPVLCSTATNDPKPLLEIVDIHGGLGLTVKVKNGGTADALRLQYRMDHGGGIFIRTKASIRNVPDIPAGDTVTFRTGFIRFGIGFGLITEMPWITIKVFSDEVDPVEKTVHAMTFGALVILQ